MLSTVTILMAIYRPDINWLIEQLNSLNRQTYNNLTLLVWNDCPCDITNYELIFNKYITKFTFKIIKGNKNLGSNKVFEKLTRMVSSEYIAYCDQDDIWLSEKISFLVKISVAKKLDLVCSDMYVIDEKSQIIANSIEKIRPTQKLYTGKEQFKYLLSHNFVTGCTMLIRTSLAKKALPFPKEYVHDWWLAFHAANINSLYVVKKPLIKYRIHKNNQTSVLLGVTDKKTYLEKRLILLKARNKIIKEFFSDTPNKSIIDIYSNFIDYRINYQRNFSIKTLIKIYKMRYLDLKSTYFELIIPLLPKVIFRLLINNIKKGNL